MLAFATQHTAPNLAASSRKRSLFLTVLGVSSSSLGSSWTRLGSAVPGSLPTARGLGWPHSRGWRWAGGWSVLLFVLSLLPQEAGPGFHVDTSGVHSSKRHQVPKHKHLASLRWVVLGVFQWPKQLPWSSPDSSRREAALAGKGRKVSLFGDAIETGRDSGRVLQYGWRG